MITLERVGYSYSRDTVVPVPALQEVSLSVETGAFLGIVGPGGSGKTTLLQIMSGLLLPTKGRVMVEGHDLTRSANVRRRVCFTVGLVFQFPEKQLFEGTVFEDVAYGPKNMGLGRVEVEDRVREALSRTGLDPERVAGRSPLALSFGEMRRVALAGVLAMRPKILLLDEPTAGLDERGKRRLGALLESLHERGVGVVVASHDTGFLSERVRDLLLLDGGRAVARGPAREVLEHPQRLRASGVAVPFLSAVLSGLAEHGRPVGVESMTVGAVADALASSLKSPPGAS